MFRILKPGAWQSRFLEWTQTLTFAALPDGHNEILAVDGKTARRSHKHGTGALHTVSIWSSQHEITLARIGVPDKTNEITVIPELLEIVQPAGAVITIDASCNAR